MQYHAQTIQNVRTACAEMGGVPCAIMLDTKGPEIRSGKLVDGKEIKVEQGKTLTLKYFPDDPQGVTNKGCPEWIAQVPDADARRYRSQFSMLVCLKQPARSTFVCAEWCAVPT